MRPRGDDLKNLPNVDIKRINAVKEFQERGYVVEFSDDQVSATFLIRNARFPEAEEFLNTIAATIFASGEQNVIRAPFADADVFCRTKTIAH